MTRVLFVSKPVAPPFDDGTKNLVRDLAGALGEGAEVLVPRGASPDLACGVRTIYRDEDRGHALGAGGAARLLAHLTRAPLPPVLHWFFTPSARSHRLPGLVARLRGVRAVWTIPSRPRPFSFDARGVERVLVFSAATRDALVSMGAPAARIEVVSPWVRPVEPPDAARVARLRAAFGLRGRVTTFAGDLGPERGSGELLEAFARVRTPDDLLVIAARPKGEGARAHRASLAERARALGVRARLLDIVTDMPALLAASDVVALPATNLEAKVDVPLVLLEALSLERPVLVAASSSAASLADHGAAVASSVGPEPLSQALSDLWSDPEARAALGRRGRARVLEEHAPARAAAWHRALYESVRVGGGAVH